MNKRVLKKYAQLIVEVGANVQKGQEVHLTISTENTEFARYIVEACYKAKADKVIINWTDDEITKLNYKYRSVKSLSKYEKWEIEKLQHRVDVVPVRIFIEDSDPDGLKGIDQAKVGKVRMNTYPILKPYIDKIDGMDQWVIAAIPGAKWAKKVFPNETKAKALEKLWDAILKAARVDDDPVKAWKEHNKNLADKCAKMNELNFEYLEYTNSLGTKLTIELAPTNIWLAGSEEARVSKIVFNPNMPTEEVFGMPKKDGVNGIVYSALPLSYQGQLIENFNIRFENGKAVEAHAEKGEELLNQMINMDEGAAYLGEVALVPYSSPISQSGILFYNTLFDENASCHLALGRAFYNNVKDYEKYSKEEMEKLVNNSMIHVDFMIGTSDLTIVGIKKSGEKVFVFKDGDWAI